jgi:mycofactocin precursor
VFADAFLFARSGFCLHSNADSIPSVWEISRKFKTQIYLSVDKLPNVENIPNLSPAGIHRLLLSCPFSPHIDHRILVFLTLNPLSTPLYRCFIFWHQRCNNRKHTDTTLTGVEQNPKRRRTMEAEKTVTESCCEEPRILEDIQVEELAIDGICGVY